MVNRKKTAKTAPWGDMGNGLYRNPVLNADYSDPDIVRVGEDFYMVCSDFHYMGMQILHSKDLINWSIINQIYRRLDIDPRYGRMEGYGKGSWAPSIKYNDGRYYVYFCTPDEGLYMSSAQDPAQQWSPLHEVRCMPGWEDPCPFWDDDGNAYLGHSTVGAGPIIIHKMSRDGKKLLDDGTIVYVGKIAEGTKIYKRNGYYYLVIPEGGVETGWQAVLRSRNIYGPYERKEVLRQGSTNINGPHQGALVELESGETWFMHFQSAGALGRVCHLQPVRWVDDWPAMGVDGEPVTVFEKPNTGFQSDIITQQTSDEFDQPMPRLHWQWNHNPVDENWSLTQRPGYLRLKAMAAPDILHARNTLTQKLIGSRGTISTELCIENMLPGQRAGLVYLCGRETNWIGVVKDAAKCRLEAVTAGVTYHGPEIKHGTVWLGSELDLSASTRFSFSLDGEIDIPLGGECKMNAGFWKGARIGLFSYDTAGDGGSADFNWFRYRHDGPDRR